MHDWPGWYKSCDDLTIDGAFNELHKEYLEAKSLSKLPCDQVHCSVFRPVELTFPLHEVTQGAPMKAEGISIFLQASKNSWF